MRRSRKADLNGGVADECGRRCDAITESGVIKTDTLGGICEETYNPLK